MGEVLIFDTVRDGTEGGTGGIELGLHQLQPRAEEADVDDGYPKKKPNDWPAPTPKNEIDEGDISPDKEGAKPQRTPIPYVEPRRRGIIRRREAVDLASDVSDIGVESLALVVQMRRPRIFVPWEFPPKPDDTEEARKNRPIDPAKPTPKHHIFPERGSIAA